MSSLKKTLIVVGVLFSGLVILVLAGLVWWHTDSSSSRFPDYHINLTLRAFPEPDGPFTVGAAVGNITPDVPDTWVDVDGDGEFDEGESWTDGNGNHHFDKVWMAGYGKNRPAAGVHDSLWARVVVFGYPGCRVALCALDLVGFFYDDVIDVRKRVAEALAGSPDSISHVIVASTHVHAGPDVMGIWGPSDTESGVDPAYLERVRDVAARTTVAAARSRVPTEVQFVAGRTGIEGFIRDTRRPTVIDDGLSIARFVRAGTDETIATVVNWGNHPEVLDDKNLTITSDFPHYVRVGVEAGVPATNAGQPARSGVGGVCIYVSGAVGGLMTPGGVPVPERFGPDTTYSHSSFDKARALGFAVAERALALMDGAGPPEGSPGIALRAETLLIPLDNRLFRAGAKIGVIDRGFVDGKLRSEVDVLRFGPSSWTFIPGEIYPEIVIGGVEKPEGGDISVEPVEVPPIKAFMPPARPDAPQFIVGLANDEIGYIIPRSQWDVEPPFTYGRTKRPYGEINSVGPDAAPAIHGAARRLWGELADVVAIGR